MSLFPESTFLFLLLFFVVLVRILLLCSLEVLADHYLRFQMTLL